MVFPRSLFERLSKSAIAGQTVSSPVKPGLSAENVDMHVMGRHYRSSQIFFQLSRQTPDGAIVPTIKCPSPLSRCYQQSRIRQQRQVARGGRRCNSESFSDEIRADAVRNGVAIRLRRESYGRFCEASQDLQTDGARDGLQRLQQVAPVDLHIVISHNYEIYHGIPAVSERQAPRR